MDETRKLIISIVSLLAFCSLFSGAIMFFYGDYESASKALVSLIVFSVIAHKGLFDNSNGGQR